MKINTKPLVSVVMPVRNAGLFLSTSINSILNQTYKNIELIIVDDASSDNTLKILSQFKDKRIKIFKNKTKLGVTKTANIAISKAKGEFIARMDGDDISEPSRIEQQVSYLLKHIDTVIVGGQCRLIDLAGIRIGKKTFPLNDSDIKKMIFTNVPMQQPAIMVASSRLPKNFVWYDENYSSAEELELLFKLFKYGRAANLKNEVLSYRIHGKNTSLLNPKKTFFLTLKTRFNSILKYGYKPNFESILINFIQAFFVIILPSGLIYPLYSVVRGMNNPFDIKPIFDVNFIFKKALELAKA